MTTFESIFYWIGVIVCLLALVITVVDIYAGIRDYVVKRRRAENERRFSDLHIMCILNSHFK